MGEPRKRRQMPVLLPVHAFPGGRPERTSLFKVSTAVLRAAPRTLHQRPHPAPAPLHSVPDAALAKQLGLNEALLQRLMELPGTRSMLDLKIRLVALADLNTSLRK